MDCASSASPSPVYLLIYQTLTRRPEYNFDWLAGYHLNCSIGSRKSKHNTHLSSETTLPQAGLSFRFQLCSSGKLAGNHPAADSITDICIHFSRVSILSQWPGRARVISIIIIIIMSICTSTSTSIIIIIINTAYNFLAKISLGVCETRAHRSCLSDSNKQTDRQTGRLGRSRADLQHRQSEPNLPLSLSNRWVFGAQRTSHLYFSLICGPRRCDLVSNTVIVTWPLFKRICQVKNQPRREASLSLLSEAARCPRPSFRLSWNHTHQPTMIANR